MSEQTQEMCLKFERAIQLLSRRWTSLIVNEMLDGPKRFSELQKSIRNLSGKVLNDRLKDMEEDGLIFRVFPKATSSRVLYTLTDKGRALAPVLSSINEWSDRWIEHAE
jgi:DNA-binding HxlR family transcriptional regulator